MKTKIVRIHPRNTSACRSSCVQSLFEINTISRIDDENPSNENETPLYHVEQLSLKCCCWELFMHDPPDLQIKFQYYEPNNDTKQALYTSEMKEKIINKCNCCNVSYNMLPKIINIKASDSKEKSEIKRFDSRAIYRTYDYLGQSQYKVGKPYTKEPTCLNSCCYCILNSPPGCMCYFCCYDKGEPQIKKFNRSICCGSKEKRIYVDIFDMNDQSSGKFAFFSEGNGFNGTMFYEVYFPNEANEMTRIALISQCLFLWRLFDDISIVNFKRWTGTESFFTRLPGDSIGIDRFNN